MQRVSCSHAKSSRLPAYGARGTHHRGFVYRFEGSDSPAPSTGPESINSHFTYSALRTGLGWGRLLPSRSSPLSLRAAKRLAIGSPVAVLVDEEDQVSFCAGVEAEVAESSSSASPLGRRRRRFKLLGIISPVDFMIASRVCQPGIENRLYVSARSCVVATRQRSASSS
jgi:hypothetical protein